MTPLHIHTHHTHTPPLPHPPAVLPCCKFHQGDWRSLEFHHEIPATTTPLILPFSDDHCLNYSGSSLCWMLPCLSGLSVPLNTSVSLRFSSLVSPTFPRQKPEDLGSQLLVGSQLFPGSASWHTRARLWEGEPEEEAPVESTLVEAAGSWGRVLICPVPGTKAAPGLGQLQLWSSLGAVRTVESQA